MLISVRALFAGPKGLLLRHLLSILAIVAAPLLLAHAELLLLHLLLVESGVEGCLDWRLNLVHHLLGIRGSGNTACLVEKGLGAAHVLVVEIIDVDARRT